MKSTDEILRFGEFTLDPANRRLLRGAERVELGARYFDTLVMLAGAPGQLISKDRLHEEVWRGVPVTDEALSQAIMALRKVLGDDAARPRFIETVPRHGYRFVGVPDGALRTPRPEISGDQTLRLVTGGTIGAIATGLVTGLVYGMLASGSEYGAGRALSLVMVLICVSILAALVSGFGIAGGIALALKRSKAAWWRPVLGGGLGGMAVGGFARLLGMDTLRLLMGAAPDRIAGPAEGLAVGTAVGLGLCLSWGKHQRLGHVSTATLGATAGLGIVISGGTLIDRKSTRLNSSHSTLSRMPSSA